MSKRKILITLSQVYDDTPPIHRMLDYDCIVICWFVSSSFQTTNQQTKCFSSDQSIEFCPHQRKSCQGLLRCASTTLTLVSSRKSGCILTATGFTCDRKDANVSWSHFFSCGCELEHHVRGFFLCEGIADGRNIKCGIEGLSAAFRKFSRCTSKIWVFRLHPLLITLALFSRPQWIPCT